MFTDYVIKDDHVLYDYIFTDHLLCDRLNKTRTFRTVILQNFSSYGIKHIQNLAFQYKYFERGKKKGLVALFFITSESLLIFLPDKISRSDR